MVMAQYDPSMIKWISINDDRGLVVRLWLGTWQDYHSLDWSEYYRYWRQDGWWRDRRLISTASCWVTVWRHFSVGAVGFAKDVGRLDWVWPAFVFEQDQHCLDVLQTMGILYGGRKIGWLLITRSKASLNMSQGLLERLALFC
jgi:hypothetical protein